jgi:hypothetical protein
MVERTMQLQCTIEQGQIWLSMDDKSAEINPVFWQRVEVSAAYRLLFRWDDERARFGWACELVCINNKAMKLFEP